VNGPDVTGLHDDDGLAVLQQELADLCGVINAAEARMVGLVADALERRLWAQPGVMSPEHWVAWQCGLSRGRAAQVVASAPDAIDVVGPTAAQIGDLAASLGATLHELSPRTASLEDVFLEVTAGAQEYRGDPGTAAGAAPPPPPPPPPPSGDAPAGGGA